MPRPYRPVLARHRGRWTRGTLEDWLRGPDGAWTALTRIPTGPPASSSTYEFLPAAAVRDALPCIACPAHRSHLADLAQA